LRSLTAMGDASVGDSASATVVIAAVCSAVGTSLLWAVGLVAWRVHATRPERVQPPTVRQGSGSPAGPTAAFRPGSFSEPINRLELSLVRFDRLLLGMEANALARALLSSAVHELRACTIELHAIYSNNSLLDPLVAETGAEAADEFTSNWFKLGLGEEQYQAGSRGGGGGSGLGEASVSPRDDGLLAVMDDLRPDDSVSQTGGDLDSLPGSTRNSLRNTVGGRASSTLPQRVPNVNLELLSWIRDSFHDWDFDMAHLRSWCAQVGVRPLVAITAAVHTAVSPTSLSHVLSIPEGALEAFVSRVVNEYRDLPYHSEMHACDVMHAASTMHHHLLGSEASSHEVGAMVLAAMVHDLAHPGVNNSFLIETSSPLAVRYNDSSVLENYHISLAFSIMLGYDRRGGASATSGGASNKAANLLTALDKAAYKRVRSDMVALVLATSFEHHFTHIGNLKSRANAAANATGAVHEAQDEKHRNEERLMFLKMLIKAADIGHPAKKWDWHVDSAKRACAEFFHQGRCEEETGLPVNPLNNADECVFNKSQTGFLEFMVKPAFDVLQLYMEACPGAVKPGALQWLQTPLAHLEANIASWKAMGAAESDAMKAEIREIKIGEPFSEEWFLDFATDVGTNVPSVIGTGSETGVTPVVSRGTSRGSFGAGDDSRARRFKIGALRIGGSGNSPAPVRSSNPFSLNMRTGRRSQEEAGSGARAGPGQRAGSLPDLVRSEEEAISARSAGEEGDGPAATTHQRSDVPEVNLIAGSDTESAPTSPGQKRK